jgi:anti-sigma B factor antagonist
MALTYTDINDNFRRIALDGRLDITGIAEIEMKLASLSATAARRVVLDLTAVTFLASIGIRAIISNAKALQKRGGKMVLLVASDTSVDKTLESTGISVLLPICHDLAEADAAALA